MRLHWWHNWTEWQDRTRTVTAYDKQGRVTTNTQDTETQERRCKKCGMIDRRSVHGYTPWYYGW